MSITFLAIAASLLTAGNPQPAKPSTSAVPISTSQVQPLAAPTPDSWQAAITPHHVTPVHEEPASLPEQNLDQKVKTSRVKPSRYSK
ncbi:hypothetical protein [Lacticaseibacillus paracasei]|uniref:hypothetical protein n=1 Tax=Lacticaseibacillus paracasei TaxID=1597 RepID=UPI00058B4826|nr:hypothetical protein [Lacticaseibacillus paracasei]ALX89754.1 hypothetical protein AWC33_11440 [Lacticaseibacillus paracasei]